MKKLKFKYLILPILSVLMLVTATHMKDIMPNPVTVADYDYEKDSIRWAKYRYYMIDQPEAHYTPYYNMHIHGKSIEELIDSLGKGRKEEKLIFSAEQGFTAVDWPDEVHFFFRRPTEIKQITWDIDSISELAGYFKNEDGRWVCFYGFSIRKDFSFSGRDKK